MRSLLYTVLSALCLAQVLLAAEPQQAQDDTESIPAEASSNQDDGPEGNDTDTEDNGLTPPEDENFVPSVRITEDLPVAFPVDI